MGIYEGYLAELGSSTLFRDMTNAEILLVLEAMQPRIKSGVPQPETRMVIRRSQPFVWCCGVRRPSRWYLAISSTTCQSLASRE